MVGVPAVFRKPPTGAPINILSAIFSDHESYNMLWGLTQIGPAGLFGCSDEQIRRHDQHAQADAKDQ